MAKKNKPKAKAKPKTKKTAKATKVKKAKVKAKPTKKIKAKAKSAPAKKGKAKAKISPKVKKAKAKVAPKIKVKPAKKVAAVKAKAKPAPKPVVVKMKEKKLPPTNGNGKVLKLRYSDKDLMEFKGIITEKLAEARKDLVLLRSSMSHLDDHGTDDTSPTFKLMEDGSDVLSKEETAQLAARQQKFIKHLEDAMVRIENKSYGICRVTGNLIPKARLKVVPHATLSIEAKQKQF